jgi:hypothetical protein
MFSRNISSPAQLKTWKKKRLSRHQSEIIGRLTETLNCFMNLFNWYNDGGNVEKMNSSRSVRYVESIISHHLSNGIYMIIRIL